MTTPYVDPQTIHNPATGTSPPASWGDAVRDGLEFLARTPGVVVQTTSSQNATTAAWYNISWNGADLRDTDGYHTGTTDTITIPTGLGGWYNIAGAVSFAANATGVRGVRYSINGAGDYRLAMLPAIAALSTRVPVSGDVLLAAGDVLRISAYQSSGGTLAIDAGSSVSVRLVAVS